MSDDEAPSPEEIWRQSPLARSTVQGIINAAGLPVVFSEPAPGALVTMLAFITLTAVMGSLWFPPLSEEDKERIRHHFVGLSKAMVAAAFTIDEPPAVPADWFKEMDSWLGRSRKPQESGQPLKTGRLPKDLDHFLFPQLLGFYELAFGEPAPNSASGPAIRFLTEFYSQLTEHMQGATWIGGGSPSHPDPKKAFLVRTPEALRGRIRTFARQADPLFLSRSINKIYRVLVAE